MTFLAHLYQEGGCDYTIGCGHLITTFKAPSWKKAKEKVRDLWDENGADEIKEVSLYEVAKSEAMPVEKWISEEERFAEEELAREKEEEERAELKRLKEKYGE